MSILSRYIPALLALLCAGAAVAYLLYQEQNKKRPDEITITTAGFLEMCLSCHTDEKPDPAHAAHLKNTLLNETSAIGLRFYTVQRLTLPRTGIELTTPWGTVRAKKVSTSEGIRITPEYEDCLRLAEERNIPLQKIYTAVAALSAAVSVHSDKSTV